MAEISATPQNGLRVVSTFSGCGGSCLGFRMAGFDVVWANEFVPAAVDTYRLNHHEAILDTRDIRLITPSQIMEATGTKQGEIDVLNGSPPCASFSTAGKREKNWSKVKGYSDTAQRTDDLFFEFARLLEGLQPKVFVAENVSGLVKGVAKGYFLNILRRLKSCGYKVQCQLLDASWLGVPQSRQRTIFIGTREDINKPPAFPKPLPNGYSVSDALNGVPPPSAEEIAGCSVAGFAIGRELEKLTQGTSSKKYFNLTKPLASKPCPTIVARNGCLSVAGVAHPHEHRKFTIPELKRICSFPDDFKLTGTYTQQWERLGRAVPPVMMFHIARTIHNEILA